MGINQREYIELAIFALIAICLLAIFNRKQVVRDLEENSGLGGWLYPAAFCFTYVLGYFCYASFNLFNTMFIAEQTSKLFDSGSAQYVGIAAQYMQIEIFVDVMIALAVAYMAYTFVAKRKAFPKLFLSLNALVLAYLFLAQVAWTFIPHFNQFNMAAIYEIGAVALGAMIWMPYMRKSKRVRITFTK